MKYKKMTLKEFKEVLNNIGNNFDIGGYEGLLNTMSLLFGYASEYKKMQNKEYSKMSEIYKEYSKIIYNALNERGYYEK